MAKHKFTITVKVTDNETGNHGDIVLHGDKPTSFEGAGQLLQATCDLINLNQEELEDVKRMTQELINKHKN